MCIIAAQILFFNRFINRPSFDGCFWVWWVLVCVCLCIFLPFRKSYDVRRPAVCMYLLYIIIIFIFLDDILLGNEIARDPFSVTYCLRAYCRLTGNHPPSKQPSAPLYLFHPLLAYPSTSIRRTHILYHRDRVYTNILIYPPKYDIICMYIGTTYIKCI